MSYPLAPIRNDLQVGSDWVWTGNGDYKGAGTNVSLKDGIGTDKVFEFNSGVKHTYERPLLRRVCLTR
ncbi:hypothetical protein D1871_20305 [Nakamurella silvestris]|nr:hypothetical protein D1871_20305 [Nakamurella silvestris]